MLKKVTLAVLRVCDQHFLKSPARWRRAVLKALGNEEKQREISDVTAALEPESGCERKGPVIFALLCYTGFCFSHSL